MAGGTSGLTSAQSKMAPKCIIWTTLVSACVAVKCAYRGPLDDRYRPDKELPLGFGIRECRWGCCWQNHKDVCCPFPQEVVVTAVVSVISSLLIISAVVILVLYMVVRNRRDFHGQYTDLLLCCRPEPEGEAPAIAMYQAGHQPTNHNRERGDDVTIATQYSHQNGRTSSTSSLSSEPPPAYSV